MWAKYNLNIGTENRFAWSDRTYEASYCSWGNVDGHNPTDVDTFSPYSFGSGNDSEPYVSSVGHGIAYPGSLPVDKDIARRYLGHPWRLPSPEEYQELFDNCDFINPDGTVIPESQANKLVTLPDFSETSTIVGIYLKSRINGERIFFPACGYGTGETLSRRETFGYYWAAKLFSADNGYALNFYDGGVAPQTSNARFHGHTIRAVW